MSLNRFRFARAGRAERHVLGALRRFAHGGSDAGGLSPEAADALRRLATAALACGHAIQPAGSVSLGPDEMRLLGWLAGFQRQERNPPPPADATLAALLRAAATALKPDQLLPYHVVLWIGGRPSETAPAGAWAGPISLRHRAIAHVRQHGRASAKALQSLGLSRQYLSELCQRGALVRVAHGLYEAPAGAR